MAAIDVQALSQWLSPLDVLPLECDGMTAPTRWTPTPPSGDEWLLVAKFDTEDGPCAMFVKPI